MSGQGKMFGIHSSADIKYVDYNAECFENKIVQFAKKKCPELAATKENQAQILAKMACYDNYRLSSEFFGNKRTGPRIQRHLMRYVDRDEKFNAYYEAISNRFDDNARGDDKAQMKKEIKRLTAEIKERDSAIEKLQCENAEKDTIIAGKILIVRQLDERNSKHLLDENALREQLETMAAENKFLKRRAHSAALPAKPAKPAKRQRVVSGDAFDFGNM